MSAALGSTAHFQWFCVTVSCILSLQDAGVRQSFSLVECQKFTPFLLYTLVTDGCSLGQTINTGQKDSRNGGASMVVGVVGGTLDLAHTLISYFDMNLIKYINCFPFLLLFYLIYAVEHHIRKSMLTCWLVQIVF